MPPCWLPQNDRVDQNLGAFLDELYQDGLAYDAAQPDRLRRRRNLEPEAARLIVALVTAMGASRLLEIGTSNGYSTIWFADALRQAGGRVLSVDVDAEAQAQARHNLDRAGLADAVELRTGDGGEVLRELGDGTVDVVFLDSERTDYAGWWPHPRRVLRPGGLLVVDNVLSHPDEVAPLRALVEADGEFTTSVVPVGKGELLAVRAH